MKESTRQFKKLYTQFDKVENVQYVAKMEYEFAKPGEPSREPSAVVVEFYDDNGKDFDDPTKQDLMAGTESFGCTQSNRIVVRAGFDLPNNGGSEKRTNAIIAEDIVKETGHTLGLLHPNNKSEYRDATVNPNIQDAHENKTLDEDNFMYHDGNKSGNRKIEISQIKAGVIKINEQQNNPQKSQQIVPHATNK